MPTRKIIFDVVDVTDDRLVWTYRYLLSRGKSKVFSYNSMSNVVAQMGTDILAKSGPRGAFVVRIWGHGLPGVVPIASGLTPDDVRDHRAGLLIYKDSVTDTYWNNVTGRDMESLKDLATAMSPVGRLELRGCSIGAGKNGEFLGKSLAKILKCWIYASTELQGLYSLGWTRPVRGFPPGGTSMLEDVTPPPLV